MDSILNLETRVAEFSREMAESPVALDWDDSLDRGVPRIADNTGEIVPVGAPGVGELV